MLNRLTTGLVALGVSLSSAAKPPVMNKKAVEILDRVRAGMTSVVNQCAEGEGTTFRQQIQNSIQQGNITLPASFDSDAICSEENERKKTSV